MRANLTTDEPSRVVVDAGGRSRGGQLVLLDAFYPGWKASVDGRGVPIRPANVAYRAVSVPPGAKRVEFHYEPPSVLVGAAISLAAWTAIIVAGAKSLTRARRRRRGTGAR